MQQEYHNQRLVTQACCESPEISILEKKKSFMALLCFFFFLNFLRLYNDSKFACDCSIIERSLKLTQFLPFQNIVLNIVFKLTMVSKWNQIVWEKVLEYCSNVSVTTVTKILTFLRYTFC